MRKLVTGFIAAAGILVLGSMTVFAAGRAYHGGTGDNFVERVYNHSDYRGTESGCGYCGETGHCYMDENGDGICDLRTEDCPNYGDRTFVSGNSAAHHYGHSNGHGYGHGRR